MGYNTVTRGCWVCGAAAALATPVEAVPVGAHDQACSHLPPLGVTHRHQLLPPQAHPLLGGGAGVCPLAGMWLLLGGGLGGLTGGSPHLVCSHTQISLHPCSAH